MSDRRLLLVLLLTAGCAADLSADVRPVPTHGGDGRSSDAALIEGRLAGDAGVDGGCLWLETADGPLAVWWPAGHAARFDPAELVGPGGQLVAREGELVTAGGGYGAHEGMARCRLGQDEVARVGIVDRVRS